LPVEKYFAVTDAFFTPIKTYI